jgi:hypothetical protein
MVTQSHNFKVFSLLHEWFSLAATATVVRTLCILLLSLMCAHM